jgi:hypothetical protein
VVLNILLHHRLITGQQSDAGRVEGVGGSLKGGE